jgi:hypothetical protein
MQHIFLLFSEILLSKGRYSFFIPLQSGKKKLQQNQLKKL